MLKYLCWSQVVNTTVKMQCYLNDKIQLTQNQKGPLSSLLLFQLFCSLGGTWGPFAFRSPTVGLWGCFYSSKQTKHSSGAESLSPSTDRQEISPAYELLCTRGRRRPKVRCLLARFSPPSATLMSNWIVQHWDPECPEII